jgi:hypothetical protein
MSLNCLLSFRGKLHHLFGFILQIILPQESQYSPLLLVSLMPIGRSPTGHYQHDHHQWMLCDGFTSISTMHTPLLAQIIKSIIMHNFKIESFNAPPRIGSKCFARMENKCVPCL